MDLHLHTPGSSDYQEPNVSYLDILRHAEMRGLDMIAFTDHNSVAGFAAMKKQIEQLLWLEERGRMEADEKWQLDEYRRLLEKILVLPGFEFTATFGFHIIGLFPPETPVSYLEHLLLSLNVPIDQLYKGSSTVGSTADVLTAYRLINEAGGIVMAAHINTNNGVLMRGLDFGGQTRIAYTQDINLHVLEVTDLDKRGHYATRRFFDGSIPEYPRPMRCIQGSDAHRLIRDANAKNLGIGDRMTEILLDEISFDSLAAVLKGNDFSLTRAYRGTSAPTDFVQVAREEGVSIVQSFYPNLTQRGGFLDNILQDICAMANTNGGTIYIGVSADPKEKPVGVKDADKAIEKLYTAVASHFSPEPVVQIDRLPSKGEQIIRVAVKPGPDFPYALNDNKFYVRDEKESNVAVRDEIVRLVERRINNANQPGYVPPVTAVTPPPVSVLPETPVPVVAAPPLKATAVPAEEKGEEAVSPPALSPIAPRTGVEIVNSQKRKGIVYHTLCDLRNGNFIKGVTRHSARKLWRHAINQVEANLPKPEEIKWQGNFGFVGKRQKDDNVWYDLALREGNTVHIYYGVTENGLNEKWLTLIEQNQ